MSRISKIHEERKLEIHKKGCYPYQTLDRGNIFLITERKGERHENERINRSISRGANSDSLL